MFSQHSLQQERQVVHSKNDIVHVKTQRSEVLSLFHHLPTSLNTRQESTVSIVTESPSLIVVQSGDTIFSSSELQDRLRGPVSLLLLGTGRQGIKLTAHLKLRPR